MPEETFAIGEMVEVVDKNNEEFTLRGVIREIGPPVVVAFTYLSNFKPKQIKKVDTLSTLTWKQLRTRAREVGVPAVGTRDELEASVAASLDAISSAASLGRRSRDIGSESDFPLDAIVQISDPDDTLRDNCRGKVIDGPSVTVRLTNRKFEVEEKRYAKSKLTRVG